MKIPIINRSGHPLPAYKTAQAAGFDISAALKQPLTLQPLTRAVIGTGLSFALPEGYEMQIRSRSGLAASHGLMCLNSPGTIDADYRGELKIILANLSQEPYTIHDGDRIAQAVVGRVLQVSWQPVERLDETARGGEGLGSTGR